MAVRYDMDAGAFDATQRKLSMAPRYWATGAARSCTTDVMTDGSESVRVETLKEQEETASG